MGELFDYMKERYSKNTSESMDMMRRTQVKNKINALCNKYLHDDETLIFEVLPKDLPYAVMVFDEEPLKSTVQITQLSKSLFSAKLIEFNL